MINPRVCESMKNIWNKWHSLKRRMYFSVFAIQLASVTQQMWSINFLNIVNAAKDTLYAVDGEKQKKIFARKLTATKISGAEKSRDDPCYFLRIRQLAELAAFVVDFHPSSYQIRWFCLVIT